MIFIVWTYVYRIIIERLSLFVLIVFYREGSYSWTTTVWQTAGNLYYNSDFGEQVSFFVQLQICGNVSNIKYKSCNVTSPVYLVGVRIDQNVWMCISMYAPTLLCMHVSASSGNLDQLDHFDQLSNLNWWVNKSISLITW